MRVAACVVRDNEGRILLAQRRADQMSGGYWEIPGGKIEPGETPKAAAARELFEETGLSGAWLKRLCTYSHQFTTGRVSLSVYVADDWSGTPRGCENQRLAWVDPTRPQVAPLLPSNLKILNLLTLPDRVLCIAPPNGKTADWVETSVKAAHRIGAKAMMLSGALTNAQSISLTRRLNQQARQHGLSVWQSGATGHRAAIRILSDSATLPQAITSSEIYGAFTNTASGLANDHRPQADILILPFYGDQTRIMEELSAISTSVATPVYAVVSEDPAHQRAALSAGATGLLIDQKSSRLGPNQKMQGGLSKEEVALSC
ncbi:RNA pyrophosphohydrolase [Ruegeria sp. THAF57]|nr:RNA pyrophosphohydrolase [Ruegeria sp. THAF57]